jgi:hypothetical protein
MLWGMSTSTTGLYRLGCISYASAGCTCLSGPVVACGIVAARVLGISEEDEIPRCGYGMCS